MSAPLPVGPRVGLILFLLLLFGPRLAVAQQTGFMVLAPDRGFLGNEEVRAVFREFQGEYLAGLSFVGSPETEYAPHLEEELSQLRRAGAERIVVLPFFLSSSNSLFKGLQRVLSSAIRSGQGVVMSAPLGESYLTAQILLDRVDELSRDPASERLVVIGWGASDASESQGIRQDLEELVEQVTRARPFREVQTAVYYGSGADRAMREEASSRIDDLILRTAAKRGQTIVIPFFLGPKYDGRMSLWSGLQSQLKDLDVLYGREIAPHPNLRLWLRKTANRYVHAAGGEIGVVIMPHGASWLYNPGSGRNDRATQEPLSGRDGLRHG